MTTSWLIFFTCYNNIILEECKFCNRPCLSILRSSSIPNERSLHLMSDGTLKRFCARSFRCGKATRAYEYFGAHRQCGEWVFRVWAPHAESVSVCGDFNGWSTDRMPMRRVGSLGVWELRRQTAGLSFCSRACWYCAQETAYKTTKMSYKDGRGSKM